jgi:hypothetical protein
MGRKEFYEKMEELQLIRWFLLNQEGNNNADEPTVVQLIRKEKDATHLRLSHQTRM